MKVKNEPVYAINRNTIRFSVSGQETSQLHTSASAKAAKPQRPQHIFCGTKGLMEVCFTQKRKYKRQRDGIASNWGYARNVGNRVRIANRVRFVDQNEDDEDFEEDTMMLKIDSDHECTKPYSTKRLINGYKFNAMMDSDSLDT